MSHLCLEINLTKRFKSSTNTHTHTYTHSDEDPNGYIMFMEKTILWCPVFLKLIFRFNKIPVRFFIVFDRMNISQ